jgi:hypothetical protein
MLRAPLFRVLLERPQLLAEHLTAYADLLGAEASVVVTRIERRVLLQALAAGLLAVAVGLAGVALMLRAVLSAMLSSGGSATSADLWLLAVPLLPALGAWAAWRAAHHPGGTRPFAQLREQLQADLAVMREAGAPTDPTS